MKDQIAKLLADLHNKAIETQNALEDIYEEFFDDLMEAQDQVVEVESTTSKLDCYWNGHDSAESDPSRRNQNKN